VLGVKHLIKAFKSVKPTFSEETLEKVTRWNDNFGTIRDNNETLDNLDDSDEMDIE
jgi:hypothetical protein